LSFVDPFRGQETGKRFTTTEDRRQGTEDGEKNRRRGKDPPLRTLRNTKKKLLEESKGQKEGNRKRIIKNG
jgi:hypothetical protein